MVRWHKHTTPHPSVKVSAWFLFFLSPSRRGAVARQWAVAYIYTTYTCPVTDIKALAVWCVGRLGWSQMSKGEVTEGSHTHIHRCIQWHAHTHMQAYMQGSGQPIRPPQASSRPLNMALMSCGIDRPSVTVSHRITVSGRGTQKRGEEDGEEERRGRGVKRKNKGSNPLLLQESLSLSFSQRQLLILKEKT